MNITEEKVDGERGRKVEEKMMVQGWGWGDMTKKEKGGKGQRKIPVSEWNTRKKRLQSGRGDRKRRPGKDSGRNAGNGKEQKDSDRRRSGKKKNRSAGER